MVLASGIPAVRRFCYTITAHAQELQAINFLHSTLSSLLNSAELRAAKPIVQPMEATLDKKIFHTLRDVEKESIKAPLLRLQSEMREKSFCPLLAKGIDSRLPDIEYTYNRAAENFAKEMKVIHSKASMPNQSSYVAAEMIPAYRSAAQEHGRGSERRQHNTIQGRVTDGTLFPNISIAIKEDAEAKTEVAFSAFRKVLLPVVAAIRNDIEMAFAAELKSLDKAYKERKNEERRRAELANTIQMLKRQRRELLGRIAYNQG
ncbi:hypothetical protein VE02_07344 [Pseudogymnoascus sp. 03VT05]|nr:hypothetical protein VE02_07344 [Pseudogymnoascus sp. 03VT05]